MAEDLVELEDPPHVRRSPGCRPSGARRTRRARFPDSCRGGRVRAVAAWTASNTGRRRAMSGRDRLPAVAEIVDRVLLDRLGDDESLSDVGEQSPGRIRVGERCGGRVGAPRGSRASRLLRVDVVSAAGPRRRRRGIARSISCTGIWVTRFSARCSHARMAARLRRQRRPEGRPPPCSSRAAS